LTAEETPPPVKTRRLRRPKTALGWFMAVMVTLVLFVGLIGIGSRYGVQSPQALLLIEAGTDGLKLGRLGKLKIEGLSGDILSSFKVRRLTIADEKGVWLEASNVAMEWRYLELLRRRLHADKVTADLVRVIRRPILTPKSKSRGLPVSFDIDSLKAKAETLPAFSVERGLFDVAAVFEIERKGGGEGVVQILSLLHQGDGVKANFKYGRDKAFIINADAMESQGGPIAGSLGLVADQPFALTARINGTKTAGKLKVLARSGPRSPLDATGAWGEGGLSANGRIELAASTLLTKQVKRFGPEAWFTITGRKTATKGVYGVDLDVRSENATLRAVGPVRASDRTIPSGLAVNARIQDLSRIVAVPKMGEARANARLTGKLSDFTLKGDVVVNNLQLADYALGQARGPAQLRFAKRELTLDASLTGAGGKGRGLFSAWMGGAPRATIKFSRLADGRFLIRSLTGKGAGFDLTAKGSNTLFGGLDFDGDVELSNLAAARKGASGRIKAKWSARRGGVGKPWAFTADGQGRDFATGMAELDRLLGPAPRLQARAQRVNAAWAFDRLDLNGKAGDVTAAGIYGPAGALKFTAQWTAQGPFRAGPVEIAGKLTGDGAIVGTVGDPRIDLKSDIEGIDLGPLDLTNAHLAATFAKAGGDMSGQFRLTSGSNYGPAVAAADYRFTHAGLALDNIDAQAGGATAAGSIALSNGEPSRAALTLALRPGAFLVNGQAQARIDVVDGASGPVGDITLTASDLMWKKSTLVVRSVNLTAKGPMSRLPYSLRADVRRGDMPISASGTGVASSLAEGWNVTFGGQGQVNKVAVKTLQPLSVNFGGPELSAIAALSVGGGRADIDAVQRGGLVNVKAVLAGVDIGVMSQDLAGKIDATLNAAGRGQDLSGQLQATLNGLKSRDGPQTQGIDGVVKADLRGDRLTVDAAATSGQGLRSAVNVVLPAEASATPFRIAINRTRAMQGRFDVDGELQPIWDLFFGGARTLGGRLKAQGTLAGTLNDPKITGQATLADGRLEDFATGLKLRRVAVAADLATDAITISRFSGEDMSNGTLTGQGRIGLARGGASNLTLTAKSFLVIDNDLAKAEASGNVTVTRGADGKAALVGRLTIDRADVVADPPTPSGVVPLDVIEINVPADRADNFDAPRSRGPSVALDVTLTAPRRIFVRGRGLNAELSLNAKVSGTTAAPQLTGEARIVRGEYDFAGKRFEFDDSGVVYLASSAERIRLNLTATREDPTLTAVVEVRGTAAKPEITLTSRPMLPQDEVLAQVLFGRSSSQLSPVEAAQLAASLAALATGGGFDVIGGLRGLAGLDRLAFGGGDASGLTVSGGKYLTDDVYLELTGGGRDGTAVQVEWRVRRNFAVVSRVAGTGDTRLSVRWRRESGRRSSAPGSAR